MFFFKLENCIPCVLGMRAWCSVQTWVCIFHSCHWYGEIEFLHPVWSILNNRFSSCLPFDATNRAGVEKVNERATKKTHTLRNDDWLFAWWAHSWVSMHGYVYRLWRFVSSNISYTKDNHKIYAQTNFLLSCGISIGTGSAVSRIYINSETEPSPAAPTAAPTAAAWQNNKNTFDVENYCFTTLIHVSREKTINENTKDIYRASLCAFACRY